MTLAFSQRISTHTLAGDLAPLNVTFPVYTTGGVPDLRIEIRDAATGALIQTATYVAHWLFTPAAAPAVGGVITPISSIVFASGRRAVVMGATQPRQDSKFSELDKFPAQPVEAGLDRDNAIMQEASRDLGRAVLFPPGTAGQEIPAPEDGKAIGWGPGGVLRNLGIALTGGITVVASWLALLIMDPGAAIAALRGVTSVPTYTGLQGLTPATGWVHGALIWAAGSFALNDGGHAWFRIDTSDTTTPNGVTVVQRTGGGAGRARMILGASTALECWGMFGNGADCTPGWDLWFGNAKAGLAPPGIHARRGGGYAWLTQNAIVEDLPGFSLRNGGLSRGTFLKGWSSADNTTALIHVKGNSGGGEIKGFALGTHANGAHGGCGIFLQAKSNSAPDAIVIKDIYGTGYAPVSTLNVSAGTTANPGVLTIGAAHGLVLDDKVVIRVNQKFSGWKVLNRTPWKINSLPGSDTVTLKSMAGTPVDTSAFGAFPAGAITIKKAACFDVPFRADGRDRNTGAKGIRNWKMIACQWFGGAEAAIEILGAVEFSGLGCTTSDAGWNGTVKLGGSSDVPTYYATFDGGTIAHLEEDWSVYGHGDVTIQGDHYRSANTTWSYFEGAMAGELFDAGSYNHGPNFIHEGGGVVTQIFEVDGVTGSYAAFAIPLAFTEQPTICLCTPKDSPNSTATMVWNNLGKTSVELAGADLHASGLGIVKITGKI